MNDNAALIVTGAVVVGGFVLGKAVVDHVIVSKRSASYDEDTFRAQHYGAAFGARRRTRKEDLNQVVSIVAGLTGIAYTIYKTPELVQGLKALAQ